MRLRPLPLGWARHSSNGAAAKDISSPVPTSQALSVLRHKPKSAAFKVTTNSIHLLLDPQNKAQESVGDAAGELASR